VPGVELKIEPARTPDADAGSRRPDRQAGELLARGPNVFGGYWNAPDRTREAFTSDGWFRTGDLGYFDKDGYLYLQGRASTLIVTESGKNIQPEEVEARYAQHPWIEEIGVLEDAGRLAALVVPRVDAARHSGHTEPAAIKTAAAEQPRKLPSYQRLAEYATSREALPRTRLGKIQRHRLAERYRAARKSDQDRGETPAGPIGLEEMSDQDRALVEEPAARQVWQWLAERYPEARLTPDTSPYMDLNIDSIEMINLTLEIKRLTGVELDEPAIAGVETVRDLLEVVVQQAETGGGAGLDPERILTEPEAYLSDEQKRWLKPLSPGRVLLARSAHLLIGVLLRVFFRLRVRGTQNLPAGQRFVLTPNHVSVLDPVVLYAAMPFSLLRNTWFAGWTGMVFKNAGMRFIARTGQTVPIDPRHAAASSLALGATVLKKGRDLVWFPEGERARNGQLKPFKPGIGLLLKHYPVQAVPVHIHGTYEAMPRGNRFPRLRPITITFGAPLDPQSLEDGEDGPAQDRISRRLHDYVAQLARLDASGDS
jgi:long-chain acyl-CoA synthetase